jgi:hypothetical protein
MDDEILGEANASPAGRQLLTILSNPSIKPTHKDSSREKKKRKRKEEIAGGREITDYLHQINPATSPP